MNILPRNNGDEELIQNHLHDSDNRQLVRSLNKKQKEFFYHSLRTIDDPLRLLLIIGEVLGLAKVLLPVPSMKHSQGI